MMRKGLLLLALLALSGLGLAQRAVSFRLSLPPAGLGVGLEAPLERNLAFRGYGDLFPSGPSFLLAGEVLFKPDLGQVDRDLKGIRPYFGGGLGGLHPRERRRRGGPAHLLGGGGAPGPQDRGSCWTGSTSTPSAAGVLAGRPG
jgi:hypothetical protein